MNLGATGKWMVVLGMLFAIASILLSQINVISNTDAIVNVIVAALNILVGLALVNYEAQLMTCETCPQERQDATKERNA